MAQIRTFDIVKIIDTTKVKITSSCSDTPTNPQGNWMVTGIKTKPHIKVILTKGKTIAESDIDNVVIIDKYKIPHLINIEGVEDEEE